MCRSSIAVGLPHAAQQFLFALSTRCARLNDDAATATATAPDGGQVGYGCQWLVVSPARGVAEAGAGAAVVFLFSARISITH